MFIQEMSGADAATTTTATTAATDPLWTLPAFSEEQLKFRCRWRWVGVGTSYSAASDDEQKASLAFQARTQDPNVCSAEYYVDNVLKLAWKASLKPACPAFVTPDILAVTPIPTWCQQHKKALWIGAGAAAAVAAGIVAIFKFRKKTTSS